MKFRFVPYNNGITISVYENNREYTVFVERDDTGFTSTLLPRYEEFDVVGFDVIVPMDEKEQRETLDRILRRLEEIGVELG